MLPNPQETVDFVTISEEILNGNFHFFAGFLITNYQITFTLFIFNYLLYGCYHSMF